MHPLPSISLDNQVYTPPLFFNPDWFRADTPLVFFIPQWFKAYAPPLHSRLFRADTPLFFFISRWFRADCDEDTSTDKSLRMEVTISKIVSNEFH